MATVMSGLKYKSWTVQVEVLTYENGRIAIQLWSADEGPIATATVNLPDRPCGPDEVWVKNWSENQGMQQWMIDQGIIHVEPEGNCFTGHVQVERYKLTPAFQALMFMVADPEDEEPNGEAEAYTDYTMRQGEMGSPDRRG